MYLVNNPIGKVILHGIDLWYGLQQKFSVRKKPTSFNKILLCNLAHLGDVVLSTSVLPWIRSLYPDASIGILVGSWSKAIVQDHLYIDRVHTIDHWKLDRSFLPFFKKIQGYWKQKSHVLDEIAKEQYDLAIDLYPYFPNAIGLLAKAKIPTRLGYTSGGFGPTLTHPVAWSNKRQKMTHHLADLLTHLLPRIEGTLIPSLAYKTTPPFPSFLQKGSYVVFHMGAGDPKKEWEQEKWKALLLASQKKGLQVVFSGKGEREKKRVQEVASLGGVDLCDLLSLREWIDVIKQAACVITVDSAAVHVASAFDIRTIVLYSGMNEIALWAPSHAKGVHLYREPPCFPCLKKEGCSSMRCIKEISVEEVVKELCNLGL